MATIQNPRAELREVRVGLGALERPMTRAQAERYGAANMPADLRRAGFETVVFTSDPQIHGARYYRVNYGKRI
ncbi:MAG: hypothetical protein L6Q68_15870 [Aquabacterium sp.]|nr:hypothetical protein [Aquabacterium sp.]